MTGAVSAVRTLGALNLRDLVGELQRRGLDAYAAERAARHATGRAVVLEGLAPAIGQELRQRLRGLGGEALVGPSAYAGAGADLSAVDVLLLGSAAQMEELADRLDVSAVEGPSMALAAALRRGLAAADWQAGSLRLGEYALDLSRRVAVMGILNVTPDSFYDGGRHYGPEAAIEHGLRLIEDGADLLDVGGDSAGGRAARVDADEEIRRVEPVIRGLARQVTVPIAVDT